MAESTSSVMAGALIAGAVAALGSLGGALATLGILKQNLREFRETAGKQFDEIWKHSGEQDARLNTVELRHEGLEREHKLLTNKSRVHCKEES